MIKHWLSSNTLLGASPDNQGRLQLIKSVITSTVNFWCSTFPLLVSCLKEIESLCASFLWSGSPNGGHKAKVSWKDVCRPHDEGGLGICRFKDTNRVFAYHLLWNLISSSKSLWVSWTKHYLLRYSSFWDVKEGSKGSWIWKKLLKLRSQIYPHVRMQIKEVRNLFSGLIVGVLLANCLT